MNDPIIKILVLGLFLVIGLAIGVKIGTNYQQKQIEKQLPAQMDSMCHECEDIGYALGYKRGKKAELNNCDDMVEATNDGRR